MLFTYNKENGLDFAETKQATQQQNIVRTDILAQTNKFGEEYNQNFLNKVDKVGVENIYNVENLAKAFGKVDESVIKYVKDVQAGKIAIDDSLTMAQNYANQSVSIFSTVGSKIKSIGGTVIASIGNALMSAGISFLVSSIISLAIKGIDSIINKTKHIKEAANEARAEIETINSELSSNQKIVSEVKGRYAELAQKVGNLGTANQNQGGLNNDEYKEFVDLSNQLAEIFPTLTKGYDDNGNAILDLSGNVDTIVDSLNGLVKVEQDLANQKVLDNMSSIWNDFSISIDDARENIEAVKESFNGVGSANGTADAGWKEQFDVFNQLVSEGKNRTWGVYGDRDSINIETKYMREAFKTANVEWEDIVHDGVFHVEDLEETEIKKIQSAFTTIKSNYDAEIKGYENEIKKQNFEMGKYVAQTIKTGSYYDALNEAEKKIAEGYVLNLDYDKIMDQAGDWDTAYNQIQDKLRNVFSNLDPADKVLIQKYYDELFAIDLSEGNYSENLEKIRKYAQLIVSVLGGEFSEFDILEALGLNTAFDKRDSARERLGYSKTPSGSQEAQRNNEINQFLNTLSPEEYDTFLAKFSFDKDASIAEIQKAWEEFQNYADEHPIEAEVKASEAVDSMADMKKAVGSLSDLYDQTVTQTVKDGLATGFADPDLINTVESSFYKFSEELKKNGNDAAANEINLALEEFEKTLIEFPGDSAKAQKAINRLITAYIDQTDVIKNLTEENKEWSKAQLTAMGITNAEEVVESRLLTTTKKLTQQFTSATNALLTLKNAQKDSAEYNQAMTDVGGKLGEMFSYTSENGETIVPNFDSTWIIQNLDMLTEAAAGSTEAMYKVQQAAAKKIAASVEINLPDQNAINGELQYINNLIDSFDISDIEVGTSLNDTPMIKGLNNLVEAGIITRDNMNAILSGIGVEPVITYEEVDISADFSSANAQIEKMKNLPGAYEAAKNMQNAMNSGKLTGKIKIPKIDYQATSKAVSAEYSNPNSDSDKGGTPGGNNNSGGDNDKLNEDSKNTFDWIEIKLKRLDEAIARLDRTTNDVYSSWIKRNSSLSEEIDKTIEKVKLQEKAYNRYNKNFENLKLSDIETKPDKKNYKDNAKQYQKDIDDWNEAETKWASGKYQDLIKNGKIGKNDIQTIKNKYLAALINEGLSRYEKAVTAGDTVQETQLKLKDLYKQEFDLIVEEFDDMLQKIEDKVAKVNEAMNLNNERGRFYFGKGNDQANNAQSKYYKNNRKNIKALEKEELDRQKKLEDKRTKLIAQRDKQRKLNEKRGGVDKDSKALADYDKQIRDTELEIKKSNTELAKLNNDTRESFIQEFEDIGTDYSNAVDLLQHKLDMVEESKNQISENGRWIVKDYYNKTISKIKERSKIESEEAKKLDKQYDKQAAKLDKMVKLGRKRGGVDMYDEDWYKMVNDLNELDKKREELKTNAIKSINEIREVHKQKFNDMCTDFDNYIARLQNGRNIISGLIERTQTKGYWVDASYYKEDKKIIAAQKAQREKERAKLIAEINDKVKLGRKNGGFDYGDEDWYEEYQKIADINQEIITLDNNIIKIDNDIRQLNWDKFDYLEKRIQEISSEAAFLQGLLSSEKDMDEYGYYNDRGWAESAMIQAQYQAAQARKKEFQKERDELEAEMNKNNGAGWNDKNMVERWNSLTSSIREATQAENQFANANKELVSKSINQHLSKLKELMNEYKETLQSAKDLYDWQKNVEDQGKNISNLRKQLTAYESDDSEAARKRRIELRQQLNEAERQLQESEMDHYISETGKILDNLYEDYEDVLTSNLESISTLMTKQMSENEAHTQQIAKGLTEIKDQFGIDIDNFNPLTDESDPSSLASKLKAIHDAMTKAVTDMQNTAENGAKDDVEYNTKQIIVNPDGTLSVKDYGSTGGKKNNTGGGTGGKKNNTGGGTGNNKGADKIDKEVEKIINRDISKKVEKNAAAAQKSLPKTSSKNNINDQREAIAKKINEKNKELQIQSEYLSSYSYELSKLYAIKKKTPRDLDYINRYETLSSSASQNITIIKNEIARLQEEMAGLSSLPYYAGGTKSVKRKEMGWTQDAGSELIYRTTDGAILTPLNQGDMVFTHEMSQRLWEIAKDGIIPVSGTTSVPNIPGATLQNLSNNNQIEIVLPNVQDYNDFKHELQNDNKFEKFIQEITVGRLNGNNSLNKRKY